MNKAAKLHKALQDLVGKLLAIETSDEFLSVFTMYQIHGGEYTGPNWGEELEAAVKVLGENE